MTASATPELLVVDDENELADVYADMLSERYDVRVATSGEKALEMVDESVEVVLLDRRMPGMSGDTVLGELRKNGLDCKVAMLTAVEPERDIVEMPFDDYRRKPVSKDELLGLVEALHQRSVYDDLSQEYFSLASEKAALELAGNDHGDEYDRLLDRMAELREEIERILERVGAEAAFVELFDGQG